jgi:hypothetical protein
MSGSSSCLDRSSMSEKRSLPEAVAPDILTPEGWYESVHVADPRFHSTKQLMLALLVNAVRCLQTMGLTAIQRLALAETEAWIADRSARGPFGFETACAPLGIDADFLRQGLGEFRRQKLKETRPQRLVRHWSNRRSGAIGSPARRPHIRNTASNRSQPPTHGRAS